MISPDTKDKTLNENISSMFNSYKNTLKQDILYFKNDVLKELKQMQSRIKEKNEIQNNEIYAKFQKYESNLSELNNKIFGLSDLISKDNQMRQKFEQLKEFKSKMEESLLTQDISVKNLSKEVTVAINNYDKILKETILNPDILNSNGKFSNFPSLIEFVLTSINNLINFKDKSNLDIKSCKSKLDILSKSPKTNPEFIMNNMKNYVNTKMNELKNDMINMSEQQNNRFFEEKVQNNKMIMDFEKKFEDYKKITENQKGNKSIEDVGKFTEELVLIKEKCKKMSKNIDNFNNEIQNIKQNINNITKDLTSQIEKLNDKIRNQNGKKIFKNDIFATSIIRKYISGEIGLNDLEWSAKRNKLEEEKNSSSNKKESEDNDGKVENFPKIAKKEKIINSFLSKRMIRNHCYLTNLNRIEMNFEEANSLVKKRQERKKSEIENAKYKQSQRSNKSTEKTIFLNKIKKASSQDSFYDNNSIGKISKDKSFNIILKNEMQDNTSSNLTNFNYAKRRNTISVKKKKICLKKKIDFHSGQDD